MITYIADNSSFKSAKMNFDTGEFDYGDWEDAWFIRDLKPCMLKYDGTVDYELDKNDYSKKIDGVNDSDIANVSYEGNAMIGIPKVYWKIDSSNDNYIDFYVSNVKVDDNYHCWSHINYDGKEIDYSYMPIYSSSLDSSARLRSLSGCSPKASYTTEQFIEAAKNNNLDSNIWYIECFSDYLLLEILLMLIGKSTNSQKTFGYGNMSSQSALKTGGTNDKGLFYGTNGTKDYMKVFGIENYWGDTWGRIAGLIYNSGFKIKLTRNSLDGTSVSDYNLTGDGYINIGNSISGSSGGYIKSLKGNDKYGFIVPASAGASSSTYFCDEVRFSTGYGCVRGSSFTGEKAGLFSNLLNYQHGSTDTIISALITCKPL